MLILRVVQELHKNSSHQKIDGLDEKFVQSSHFSFITSIRIATECKHNTPDAIIVSSSKDAMAAISAKKINADTSLPYPIIFYIDSNTKVPLSINREIAHGVEALIFENDELLNRWSQLKNFNNIKHTVIIPQPGPKKEISSTASQSNIPILGFVGSLENTSNLKKMITAIENIDPTQRPIIKVAGTTKARYITPLIRTAKAKKIDIQWLGEDYNLETLLSELDGFILSDQTLTQTEKRLLFNGIPIVDTDNLHQWLNKENRLQMSHEAKEEFGKKYDPALYLQSINTLIDSIKLSYSRD